MRSSTLIRMAVAICVPGLAFWAGQPCRAAPGAPPNPLERPANLWGKAATIAEAAALLSEQADVDCAVRHEPAQPDAEKPRQRLLDYRKRPLREILDGIAQTFGCVWTEMGGVYVFRPAPPTEASAALQDAIKAAEAQLRPPSREDVQSVLDALGRYTDATDPVPVDVLPPGARKVINQGVAYHLLGVLRSRADEVARTTQRYASARRLEFGPFAQGARVTLSENGLMISYPDPVRPGLGREIGCGWQAPTAGR